MATYTCECGAEFHVPQELDTHARACIACWVAEDEWRQCAKESGFSEMLRLAREARELLTAEVPAR